MVALIKFLFFAATTPALADNQAQPVHKRDFPSVTINLSSLSSSYARYSTAVASYTGGGAGLAPILSAESAVQTQINKTTTETKASPPFTPAQAQSFCNYFTSSLGPIIKNTLNVIVAKKTQFKQSGLGPIVQSILRSISSSHVNLASAELSKVAQTAAAQKSCASAVSSSVIGLFNSAISAYSVA